MATETIRPDSIEAKAQAIRELGIRITEVEGPEVEEVKRRMIWEFARDLQESGKAPEITRHLYDTAPLHLETQPGHWYGVYVSGERGKGRLFTVQKILANSDQTVTNVSLHDHPMPETTVLVEGSMQSVMEISGRRFLFETQPLTPHEIQTGIPHGVINPQPVDAIGFCIR